MNKDKVLDLINEMHVKDKLEWLRENYGDAEVIDIFMESLGDRDSDSIFKEAMIECYEQDESVFA